MTVSTAVLAHTEASVHSQLVLRATVALSLTDEAFKGRFRPVALERISFATGLERRVVARVSDSPEFAEELEILRAKLRDDPLTETMNEELGLLAIRGLREIRKLLDDPNTSQSKKVDTAFKLLDRRGAGTNGMINLISADAVNILQVSGGPTPEEAAVLRQMRDRALRGEPAPPVIDVEAIACQ